MPEDDWGHLAEARQRRREELGRLARMSPEEVAYIDGLHTEPGDEGEHDDEPKLTAEEWAWIRDVTRG